jgi:hypothetical protein
MRAGWQLPLSRLLLLSGRDITAREFEDVRTQDKRWVLGSKVGLLEEERFADADHTFSTAKWRDSTSACCSRFLARLSKSAPHESSSLGFPLLSPADREECPCQVVLA